MSDTFLDALQYYGAGAATLAALVVSLNLGRRWTGWAFVIFVPSSVALIAWGFLPSDSEGIGWQNVSLLIITLVGFSRSEGLRIGNECAKTFTSGWSLYI